ncbi:NAD(P)-binding protein [Cylindrobasidium torrendii FP15055 ss-10]|uniref:NAD(P)-binding protein n=1 Tax=Cylindrobasidium torrendii FP15055 ss-10 TaxID=1314674 RepID=A0A0D7BES4_9AGAR|nr:NAD(P)-binding protein [Cylindrobasidium torrendii FP15055 ss-10]
MGSFLQTLSQIPNSLYQCFKQSYPPKPKWSIDSIPDLTGRVVLVTGGNTGIGKATVHALLRRDATVYMACRDEAKARQAIEDLKASTGKEAIFLKLDLSDQSSIRAAAAEFLAKETQLHVLFNNAGVMIPPLDQVDNRGYDIQFSTNVIGHFLLTELLVPALTRGAATSPDKKARVVHTSSIAIWYPGTILDLATLQDGAPRRRRTIQWLYAQSKLGNVLISFEMARRYADKDIISVSLNPGNIDSDLFRHRPFFHTVCKPFLHSPAMGALSQLWAGTAPEAVDCNGKFLIPWIRFSDTTSAAQDAQSAAELWRWLEDHTSVSA